MKIQNFTPAVFVVIGAISLSSCYTAEPVHYPREPRRVVVVEDRYPASLPPGQAKKIYGGRSARGYAPGQQRRPDYRNQTVYYPLIIIRTPDIIIRRAADGRDYCLNRDGYYYWRGADNRFYLDERYIGQIRYDEREYRDWDSRRGGKHHDDDDDDDHHGHRGRGHRH